MILGVALLGDDLGDLSKVGVDEDDAVLVDLGQNALAADVSSGGVLDGQSALRRALHAVGVGGQLHAVLVEVAVVQDVAAGDSHGVGSESVLNIGADLVLAELPNVARTAESVVLVGELLQIPGLVQVAVVFDSTSSRQDVLTAGGLDLLTIGDGLRIQSVEHDLRSSVTGELCIVVILLAQHVGQTGSAGELQNVDLPGRANKALFLSIVAQGDQDHLQELDAGELAFGSVLVVANAGDDALLRAVRDVGNSPVILGNIHKGVGGVVQLANIRVAIVEHGNDLSSLGALQGIVGLVGRALTIQHTDRGEYVNSLDILDVFGVSVDLGRVNLGACDGGKAQQSCQSQHKRQNFLKVLH